MTRTQLGARAPSPPLSSALPAPRNAAVIKATTARESYLNLADAADGGGDATPGGAAAAAGATPLSAGAGIPKKAGLRTHGVLFLSSAKTWWAGLFLIVLSALVMAVTLLTAGGGAH